MKEAIGGTFILQMIVTFIVIIMSYLAFSVNYTKAFRVKNEIRSIIERNEGLTCQAQQQIKSLMVSNNYHQNPGFDTWCENNGYKVANMEVGSFCYKYNPVNISGDASGTTTYKGAYYTVATFVDIHIPLVEKMLPITGGLFLVKGETALIYATGLGDSFPGSCS